MNRIVLLLIIVFTTSSYSQFINGYGVKVGGSVLELNWDHYSNGNNIGSLNTPYSDLGFNAGVFVEYLNSPNISIVTELNYFHKVAKQEFNKSENEAVINYNYWTLSLDYINVSILSKPKYDFDTFTPYLLLGPSLDIEINREIEHEIAPPDDYFNKTRFGLKLGLGSEVKISSFEILAEFVYNIPFTDLYKDKYETINTNTMDFRIGLLLLKPYNQQINPTARRCGQSRFAVRFSVLVKFAVRRNSF